MRTPPFLLAAALLLWGRETGQAVWAAALALLLEAPRLSAKRFDLSLDNQNRIADLCTALFAIFTAYAYATGNSGEAAQLLLLRSPLFFAPLLAAQAYGSQNGVDAGAFFWSLRQTGSRRVILDLSFPFVGLALLAAAGANTRSPSFYPLVFALTGWALWHQRPRWAPAAGFAALLALAGALGYAGHRALTALQPSVEQKALDLAYSLAVGPKDVFRNRTALGSIGELKSSGRILLRVRTPDGRRPPGLLRNAAYDVYKGRDWLAGSAFAELPGLPAAGSWVLGPPAKRAASLRMDAVIPGGEGPLPLPGGTLGIEGLPAETLKRSRLGAVVVEGGPKNAELTVFYGAGPSGESPPSPADLAVPEPLRAALGRTAAALALRAEEPRAAMSALRRRFDDDFTYSLTLAAPPRGVDPLLDFLERTRAGHCQYFATATTLLLRSAGIPARYVTGFAVLEHSRLERAWLVRQRHAHAWTQVFVDGAWVDLDTTPASWAQAEDAEAPAWQPAADVASWLKQSLRRALREDVVRRGAMWGLAAVALFLAWRLRTGLGALRLGRPQAEAVGKQGADSEFYRVEAALRERGLGRRPHEPTLGWARRVAFAGARGERLISLARLHERYRFDPAGLGPGERDALRDEAAAVLADFDKT